MPREQRIVPDQRPDGPPALATPAASEPTPAGEHRVLRINPDLANASTSGKRCLAPMDAFEQQRPDGSWERVQSPYTGNKLNLRNATLTSVVITEQTLKLLQQAGDGVNTVRVWETKTKWREEPPGEDGAVVSFDFDSGGKIKINNVDEDMGMNGFFLFGFDFSRLVEEHALDGSPVFRNIFAQHANFSGLDLSNSDFHRANLHACNFNGTNIDEADFALTICWGVDFRECSMTKTLFREAAFIDRARFTPLERNLMGAPDKAIITAEDTDRYERINTLNVITRYRVAWDCKLETLEKHYDEINHLLVELDRLRAIEIGPDNWDEYYDSWASLGMLYDTFTSKIALGTIEALFSSNEVGHDSSVGPRDALGMAKAMYATRGEPPYGLMLALKLNVGRILRTPHYFDFVQKLRAEQSSINRIKLTQQQGQLLINNAILAAGVGVANFVQKMIYALVFPDAAAAEEASSNAD